MAGRAGRVPFFDNLIIDNRHKRVAASIGRVRSVRSSAIVARETGASFGTFQ